MPSRHRLAISFSGGETSAYMTHRLMSDPQVRAECDVVIQFANTGQENEKTLTFVERCAQHFGWPVVMVEAQPRARGVGHRVVTFETASRNGEPFEAVIRKFGIPNSKFRHCTRSLKQHPMQSYLRSIGWKAGSYDTAIGIRADEFDRCSATAKQQRLIYPLATRWPMTKPEINAFWMQKPFRLGLKGYEGNCQWCWKKSFRKHMTLLTEKPDIYDFPERMERENSTVGPEFKKERREGYKRQFFRGNRTVADLRDMTTAALLDGTFSAAKDDAEWTDPLLDQAAGGCGEQCDVFGDERPFDALAGDEE